MNLHDLYNGHKAVAERSDQRELQDIHIETSLDKQIQHWIKETKDVVLTGNPGDGKTHLINILDQQGLLSPAYTERDASQKTALEILDVWMQKRESGIPFVLAINHAPLRELSVMVAQHHERYQPLNALSSIPQEIDSMIYYNEPEQQMQSQVMVIDLSLRNLLDENIIQPLIEKLCSYADRTTSGSENVVGCQYCPPNRCLIESNTAALTNPTIRSNILALLHLVARRRFHITMRDLIGLFAYLIVGDEPCTTRWNTVDDNGNPPRFEDYAYYNLLFTGRSPLFQAIRDTFDPATYSDPETDMDLWQGSIQDGWLMSNPPRKQPASIEELRQLKRRYFFEHDHDTDDYFDRVLSQKERAFDKLVRGTGSDYQEVENLVEMINLLYAPIHISKSRNLGYELRLRLWNSHRYSVGRLPGYVAMRALPVDKLCMYRPKLVSHLSSALSSIYQDHVLLGIHSYLPGDPALRIDWATYQVLAAAKEGKPMDVQPFHILRRLDLFLRGLGADALGARDVETIEWSDLRRRRLAQVQVNRTERTYEKRG